MHLTRAVRHTADLQRIKSLPRRTLSRPKAEAAARELTPKYALAPGAQLRPWQAIALREAVACRGAFLSLPVGQGKTLICETLPVALGVSRAVLVIPASLRDKTYSDRRELVGKWRTASPPPRIITREELALEANARLLDDIDPELIIPDECDELANPTTGAAKRIDRFIAAKRKRNAHLPWPHGVACIAMTGTPSRRSIMNYWHILRWCLGDGAPVPADRSEAEMWALALDDAAPRQGFRPAPGALGATIEQARAWYLDRLEHTPGVVLVDEDSAADVPLTIRVEFAPDCPKIDAAFDVLRRKWESPSGEEVSDPLSLMRIDGHLGCGLFTYWDPPPPTEWRLARKDVAAFIRKRCAETQRSRTPLDTDAQVLRAHPDHPAVVEWQRVRKMFDPLKSSHSEWLSDATLEWAREWLLAERRPTILWSGSVDFAERLAAVARLPYFGPKGREVRTGVGLHEAKPERTPHMICSWHANKRGFNLQGWRRNGIILPPQSAKYLEQTIGRPHRAGQTEPVEFTILATSGGTLDAFAAAFSEAEFVRETVKHTQKILRATIEPLPTPPADSLRWVTR